MFEELQASCIWPPLRTLKANAWVSEEAWSLVDHRATLWRMGVLSQANTRRLGRQVKASLKSDRIARAAKVGSAIKGHLESGDLQEALQCLKRWYATVSNQAPKPCYKFMAKQMKERVELYRKVPSPGDLILINVEPFDIKDAVPEDVEIRGVAAGL